jgi:LysR family glycine cleavage system transcriptional activator
MRSLGFLQYLRAFEAVARIGTLRGAADELALSPSAVSLQLRKLGEATGLILFRKSGRNVVLTQAGREFSHTVTQSLGQLAGAVRSASDIDLDGKARSLTIFMSPSLGIAWLTATLVEFAEAMGTSRLTLRHCMRESDVDWTEADIAVVYDNPPFANCRWLLLSAVKLRPVCSPILFPRLDLQHRERKLGGITLLHEDDGQEWARWATAARVSLEGCGSVRVPTVAHAVASAVQGQGIALVSDVLTRSHFNDGRVIQPFSTSIDASWAYYIVWPFERSDDPLIQALIGRIMESIHPAGG